MRCIERLLLPAVLLLISTNLCQSLDSDGTCQLLALVPFHNEWLKGSKNSDDFIDRWPPAVMAHYGYTYLASALLAVRHFNERDTSVVPELATLKECPVHFPEPVVVDSAQTDTKSIMGILTGSAKRKRRKLEQSEEYHVGITMSQERGERGIVTGIVIPEDPEKEEEEIIAEEEEVENLEEGACTLESLLPQWCAVLGPKGDRSYSHVSALTSAFQIPQVAYAPMSDAYMGPASPSTLGLHMPSLGQAEAILSWCAQKDRSHLAVIYSSPRPLQELAGRLLAWSENVQRRTSQPAVKVILRENTKGAKIEDTLNFVKDSGIKTILLALDTPEELRIFANALQEQNMLGNSTNAYTNNYVYILLENTVSVDAVQDVFGFIRPATPLDNLLNGAVVMSPISDRGANDKGFLEVWRAQNKSFVEELNELVPVDELTGQPYFTGKENFFQEQEAAHMASYMYDAVMSVGFGACRHMPWIEQTRTLQSAAETQKGSEEEAGQKLQAIGRIEGKRTDYTLDQLQLDEDGYLLDDSSYSEEHLLVDSILDSSFTGASGHVQFLRRKSNGGRLPLKARAFNGPIVGAFNIRPVAAANNDTMNGDYRTYSSVLTGYSQMKTGSQNITNREWKPISNEAHIFRSGSSSPPQTSVEVMDQNYLTNWVQAVGLTLFGVALFLALGSMFCVGYYHEDAEMKAGQPQFLALLCAGATLLACSIFTLSFDESDGWTQQQLDWACVMTPWFFFVGHLLMFGSLYTKLWKVDKVMQFKRGVKLKKRQVAGPLVIVLLVAMAILTTWSLVDPWRWERELVQDFPPLETYGMCTCDHFEAWFLSLTGVIVFGKINAAVMAWKTADIPRQFSDTSSAYYAISTHLQAWFIGYPILVVLGSDSADAVYFGRVLIIWIFSVSGVLIVVVPKIYSCSYTRRHPELQPSNRGRVKISGLSREQSYSENTDRDFTMSSMDKVTRYNSR